MINNSLFILEETPNYHPIIDKWERIEFYREQKRRCMEGYWVAGCWMPGELYYYVNFHNINKEDGIEKGLGLPLLRDIDWNLYYVYTEAIGFSGFELDDKYTCHRAVREIKDGKKTLEEVKVDYFTFAGHVEENMLSSIIKNDGTLKEYIEARDYLPKIHKTQLGKPLYYNQAKHLMNLSSRGWGKSYSASGMIAHNYLFSGTHDYDKYIEKLNSGKPLKSETNVGAIDAKYSGDLMEKVKVAFDNLPGGAIVQSGRDSVRYPSLLFKPWSGSMMAGARKPLTSDEDESVIHHRTLMDNALVFNGTRPGKCFLDEAGFISNLLEAWEAIEATQANEDFKRLTIYCMGTGGLTSGGAAMYAHEVFYNPEAFGCLSFDDEWEGRGKIGYFLPATMAKLKHKEGPNLITNKERALADIEEEREVAKKAPTRTKLMGTIINKPLVPSEIFLRMEGTFFPVQDLKMRLAELESVNSLLGATYKYTLNLKDSRVVPSLSEKPVIREFPLRKGFDMDACIEVYELPKKDANGHVFNNRYIAGWDPVVNDGNEDTSRSLQSLFVMDLWTERIVAEYTARTYLAEDYYEQCRRLLVYFNAVCNYESNIKGPYAYFKNKNSLHLLVETPEILKDQNMIKGATIGNRSLGTNTNDNIINWSLGLILSWLENDAYDKSEGTRNLDVLLSPALLKELISFSKDINADRVSALGMVMILKEDRARVTELSRQHSTKTKSQDPFWNKAYGRRHGNVQSGLAF